MADQAGWYPDPAGRHQHRYWDGQAWTSHVGNNGVVTTDEINSPATATPPATHPARSQDAEIAALQEADERGDAEASVLLGQALRKVGKYDLAREAYERGDARGHPEAAMSLGNMLSEIGDYVGARMAFERGIAAGSTMAALNLGLMLADSGEVDDALRYLAVARKQGDPEADWAIGKLLVGKGDRMGAIEAFRAGAAAGFGPAAYELGVVLYELGDNAGAKDAFQRAAALGENQARPILEAFAREPDGALARQLAHQLATESQRCHALFSDCSALSVHYQKAVAVANMPQNHPIARDRFLAVAEEDKQKFLASLADLRAAQGTARSTRSDFLQLSPA